MRRQELKVTQTQAMPSPLAHNLTGLSKDFLQQVYLELFVKLHPKPWDRNALSEAIARSACISPPASWLSLNIQYCTTFGKALQWNLIFFLLYCANEFMVQIISYGWGNLSSGEGKGTVEATAGSTDSRRNNSKQWNAVSHPFSSTVGDVRDWSCIQVCVIQGIADFLWIISRAAASIDKIQSNHFCCFLLIAPGTNINWCTGSLCV